MSETVKTFFAGVILIGVIAAVGMHAKGLAVATKAGGQAGGNLITSAEGQAEK